MENIYDYKEEIISTRKGGLGSSDAAMLAKIDNLGEVPKAAYARMAVVKGLREPAETPTTRAMRFGDEMEMAIFAHLKEGMAGEGVEIMSNKMIVSEKYSRPLCRLFTHPDIIIKDNNKKTISIYEVKTSKEMAYYTKIRYKAQLYTHYMLGKEWAMQLGRGWRVRIALALYNTNGLDLDVDNEFDVERLRICPMKFSAQIYDIAHGMDVVQAFLEGFNEYYEGDEVESEYLPEKVRMEFDGTTRLLAEIQEREQKVNEFKKRLYDFMLSHDIKSIKSENYSITRVDDSESVSFDYKKWLEDYQKAHPYKARKIVREYEKRTKRKGYVTIKLK